MSPKRRMMATITIRPTITKGMITKVTTTNMGRFLTPNVPANWCWTFPPKRSPRPIGR
jgi:hypothetical protein